MVLTAVRGALGFFTRLPVGRDVTAWEALRGSPATIVVVAYPIGLLLSVPFFLPAPAPIVAFAYLSALVVLTGVTHLDGLADLCDAAVVHGPPPARRRVMRDTRVGVGGVVAVVLVVTGLALAGWTIAGLPLRIALALVVAAEVAAKVAMATIVCLGESSHPGMATGLVDSATHRDLPMVLLAGTPAAVLAWPIPAAAAAVATGVVVALVLWRTTTRWLGGVGGDVLGAANELGRVAALHAGVIAWTLW